jgi:SAM-dependent methyltransferase
MTGVRAAAAWPDVVCPNDRQALQPLSRGLECPRGHVWDVREGIPRMVPAGRSYADAFGLQWNTYRRTQLDSFTGVALSGERVRRCAGDAVWSLLHRESRTDVLEVGCGAGRFTEILLSTRAHVTSVDLSSAVEANQQNFPQDDRHRILQADVLRLPFREQSFELVFCLGVIQHTPDPEQTIAALWAQVKPGGFLVIDHYAPNLSWYTKTAPLFRAVMKRLPPETALAWSRGLVTTFYPLHRAARNHRWAQALVSRVSPVLTYFHSLPLAEDLQRQWALLDTHDALTDWYKHFRTRAQIQRALEELGAVEIWCENGGNGVEARGRRAVRAAS